MKPHERRAAGAYPYFVLAKWDGINMAFRDEKRTHPTHEDAVRAAKRPGHYRVATVTATSRTDGTPFDVPART